MIINEVDMKLEFKSYSQQIKKLKEEKNVVFETLEDEKIFTTLLKRNNYINVINPYKIYFLTGKNDCGHIYDNKTDYREYMKYFEFDLEVSHQLLKVVFELERFFSTTVSYNLTKALSVNSKYFDEVTEKSFTNPILLKSFKDKEIFDEYYTSDFQAKLMILKVSASHNEFSEIKKAYDIFQFKERVRNEYRIDDISKNEWFHKINFMSFEDVLFLYKVMSYEDQLLIAKDIAGREIPVEHFKGMIRKIKKLRNKLAHLENLTIIINKQLETESPEKIIKGMKIFNTIENTYKFLQKDNPDFFIKLKDLYKIRLDKYSKIEL